MGTSIAESANDSSTLKGRHSSRTPARILNYLMARLIVRFHIATIAAALLAIISADRCGGATPSFRHEVMAVLSKAGCNLGTCHGNAYGKGGLKLSLRGQSPLADFQTLTRQLASRRVSVVEPMSSLLLQKPLMSVPHVGGRRFDADSPDFAILHDWIAAGLPGDAAQSPELVGLDVQPRHATLYEPDVSVRLKVTAEFTDGERRDVSRLAVYDSSATFVSLSSDGVATAEQSGLTTVTVRYLNQQVPVRLEFVPERSGFVSTAPEPANFIDQAVFDQLERLRINPSPVCDDVVFLRRAFLDVTGLLPTRARAERFLASNAPDKRSKLVRELLDSEEFNDMQALRWADLLRVEEKTLDRKGVEVFHDWIRKSFAQMKPLNVFAKELLEARGSTYKVPPTNYYRALRKPEIRAESTAQVFLGIRLQCAKCHNHPFDHWTQDDYYGWTNFFGRVDYKIIENKRRDKNDKNEFVGEQVVLLQEKGDVKNPSTGAAAGLRFLGSNGSSDTRQASVDDKLDRLRVVADWMSDDSNERFATTQANRIWFQLMGRGIVDPVDDFRATNPPSNPELLNALRKEFVEHDFSVRHLMGVIMRSNTYQLASSVNETNARDESQFSRIIPRRLTAEQTIDAISQALDVPVKFGGHDAGTRAVQLKGVRNGDHRYAKPEIGDRFLALFGKPGRLQSCDCERTDDTSMAQAFELVSGELVQELLISSQGRIHKAAAGKQPDSEVVTDLYWAALSRKPTGEELAAAVNHIKSSGSRRSGIEDVAWAVLNSNEFLFRR